MDEDRKTVSGADLAAYNGKSINGVKNTGLFLMLRKVKAAFLGEVATPWPSGARRLPAFCPTILGVHLPFSSSAPVPRWLWKR